MIIRAEPQLPSSPAAGPGRVALQRVHDPEIIPLEVSDFIVDGATLWNWSLREEFPSALRKAIKLFQEDGKATRPASHLAEILQGIDAVLLTGGRTRKAELASEMSSLKCHVFCSSDDVFAGERGGFHLLESRLAGTCGWVADLGKSQFKLAAPGRRWVFKRDWERLRAAVEVAREEFPSQRRRLREFISVSLQRAMSQSRRRPGAMVFALPTRLTDDGTPHGSSYAGMSGDRALITDSLKLAGLDGVPVLVLNDAELAAFGARLDERLTCYRKVLVLTLGFGIGAALIRRR